MGKTTSMNKEWLEKCYPIFITNIKYWFAEFTTRADLREVAETVGTVAGIRAVDGTLCHPGPKAEI